MRFHKARRTAAALLVSMTTAITLAAVVSQPSQAATTSGYPSALVETNVAARDAPWRIYAGRDTYAGGTLPDPRTRGRQTASVMCWYDGEGVSGNYWTNRWFKVLVWESWDGYNVPRFLFVHASYVYNQPVVRMCNRTSTGWW